MFKVLLTIILAIGILAISVRVVTDALFADTQTVGGNAFVTGTVDISTAPISALLSLNPMAPGDEVNNPITISNAGSLQLRYAIQRSADDPDAKALRDVLRLRVGLKVGAGCDFPYYNADGSATALTDDVQLFEGLNFPATATDTVGSAAQGANPGDRVLAPASSEDLCFAVMLPLATSNAYQAAATTAAFEFISEQTANN